MANTSSSQSSAIREYVVRVPKTTRKRYHMMRFNSDLGTDFFKTWTQCRMERENNLREYRLEEEIPKFGAGSEFGREQREEARRKRFGINVRKYRSENQPWMLNIGGKNGKKYKGIREGGVADNTSWYVFMQGKDGSFEAYPVDEWYNFQPIQRYKALSAEEAEEEFIRRDKIMNYFQVMYEKKFKRDGGEPDEEETKKKGGGSKKSLMLSEMDEWFSEDDDDDDDDDDRDGNEDEDGKEKKKKKKKGAAKKKSQGGKKKKLEGGESDDSCEEESDDMNEGAEHDYISTDSSDSDLENEEVAGKEMAGVAEGDALRKLLESDDDEDEEENKDKEEEEEEKKEEEKEEKDKKKKKKKKKDKKSDKDSGEDSSDYSSDEHKKKTGDGPKHSEKKNAVNELKRKVKENPMEMPPQKRAKTDNTQSSVSSSGNCTASSSSDGMEEAIRRYLTRKPMTTTELLRIFKKKKEMLSSEQLVTTIAQILKRVNPVKRMIKGKMYLSLKAV